MMTSLPIEELLYIESSPVQRSIILQRPYQLFDRFLDKYKGIIQFQKGSTFLDTVIFYFYLSR